MWKVSSNALGYDGQVYNLNKTLKEMRSENRNILNTELFIHIITENIDNTMRNKKVIKLTESDLHRIIKESVKTTLNEEFGKEWNYGNDDEWDGNEELVYDRKGNEIHNGSIVIWRDPETGHKARYEVYEEPTEDMVKLWSKYGECEALPRECVVIG